MLSSWVWRSLEDRSPPRDEVECILTPKDDEGLSSRKKSSLCRGTPFAGCGGSLPVFPVMAGSGWEEVAAWVGCRITAASESNRLAGNCCRSFSRCSVNRVCWCALPPCVWFWRWSLLWIRLEGVKLVKTFRGPCVARVAGLPPNGRRNLGPLRCVAFNENSVSAAVLFGCLCVSSSDGPFFLFFAMGPFSLLFVVTCLCWWFPSCWSAPALVFRFGVLVLSSLVGVLVLSPCRRPRRASFLPTLTQAPSSPCNAIQPVTATSERVRSTCQ